MRPRAGSTSAGLVGDTPRETVALGRMARTLLDALSSLTSVPATRRGLTFDVIARMLESLFRLAGFEELANPAVGAPSRAGRERARDPGRARQRSAGHAPDVCGARARHAVTITP